MVIDTSRLLEIASGSLAAGEQEVEDSNGRFDVTNLIEILSRPAVGGVSRVVEEDLGVGGAFAAGLKTGLVEPFRLLGAEPEEATLDETSEQVANFLGSMVGLGISFVPFAFGTGIALRGLGLTAKIAKAGATAVEIAEAGRSQALFNFVRNTAAGATQFAGTAEELAEVPAKAATGAVFGAAIEGVFLARAMRGRRGAVGKESLINDGNPVPDVPVDLERMVTEVEISPSANKTVERMTLELDATFTQNKPYDEVIVDLLGEHVETARFTGLSLDGSKSIMNYAKENFPTSQRLSRRTGAGVHEVLIHEPFDPSGRLTPKQIEQWKATGYAEGEQLTYAGRPYAATGVQVAEGKVQLRDPFSRRSIIFAAPVEEVTRPVTTKLFPKGQVTTRDGILRGAIADIENRIGFVVPSSTVARGASLSARRGFVDVSEFETATSFREFAEQFSSELATVQAATPEEAVSILAQKAGIPGLRIVDEGMTTRVHIFDQKSVEFIPEPPRPAVSSSSELRPIGEPPVAIVAEQILPEPVVSVPPTEVPNLGLVLDDAMFATSLTGEPVLSSFVPSWRNSISAPLREAGIPEKEIAQYLDLYAINTTRRLDSLMDSEFQAIKEASQLQFGGCP